jgi:RimJ/RimL family protein N-acetyltransferase
MQIFAIDAQFHPCRWLAFGRSSGRWFDLPVTSIWTGRKVRVRGIEPADWAAFQHFDEHSPDMRDADMVHPPRSAAGYREWAATRAVGGVAGGVAGDEFLVGVETLADATLVGTMSTNGADRRAGRFSYGVAIGRAHHRRGYASDAIPLLLAFMFGERRYHKCEVVIHAYNEASLTLHDKLGFQTEGRLRDHEFFAGAYHDVVLMGLTVDEFAARYPFPDVTVR